MSDLSRIIEATAAKSIGKNSFHGKCPAHEDRIASLSFRQCDDGRLLIHCHAGCQFSDVLNALGLQSGRRQPVSYDVLAKQRKSRVKEQKVAYRDTAQRAQQAWKLATPAPENHPYLQRKCIKPHGIGVLGGQYSCAPSPVKGTGNLLVIPVRTATLHSVQFISEDGAKAFIRGSQQPGGYHAIGEDSTRIWLVEGFATGASLHEETGEQVLVTFNTNGLKHVAASMEIERRDFAVMADDDWCTKDNPGVSAARKIEQRYGIPYFLPDWSGLPRGESDTDFNDLVCLKARYG